MKLFAPFVAAVAMSASCSVSAQNWHFGGFVNQALINTSDNFMFGRTDDAVSSDYREIAAIVSGPIIQNVDFSSQILSRKAGTADNGKPQIDYGFVSWRFIDDISFTHGFRVGRLKTPIGFYNDTRESPFTRNGVFLPQSIYLDRARNYIMRADELMYFGEWRSDDWTLNWKFAAGKNIPDKEELVDFYRLPEAAHAEFKSANVRHVQAIAEYDAGRIRFGYSTYDAPVHYSLDLNGLGLGLAHMDADAGSIWRVFSFEYNATRWSFTSEYESAIFDYNGVTPDPLNPRYKDYPEALYGQFLWRLTPTQEIFLRKESLVFNKHDPNGTYNATLLGAQLTGSKAIDKFGRATTIGWGYRPSSDWLIRLDLSTIEGTQWMTLRDAPAGFQENKHWNMAAFAVSWRF